MSRKTGFTLVELLIVVGIIALLIALIMPSLGRARDLAKKVVCATKLSAFGRAMIIYVADHDSYPPFAPVPWPGFWILDYPSPGRTDMDRARPWPKTYGALQSMGIQGTHKTNLGSYAYFWEADEIWEGCFCPAMDAARILDWCSDPGDDLYKPKWKIAYHPAAIGYQWNFRLRAKTHQGSRWTPTPDTRGEPLPGRSDCLCQNVPWVIHLPNDTTAYAAQAIHPDEVAKPSQCAEAWDSPDFKTLDWTQDRNWRIEALMPGFFCGPQTRQTNGWALLNGARHPSSPNVLYVDGAVRPDATRRVKVSDLGACPSGTWEGLNVNTWPDWDETFGTMHHVFPDPQL